MKKFIRQFSLFPIWAKNCFVLFIILVACDKGYAQNLITNGDFETSGGFTSNYFITAGPNSNQREYAVVSNPATINPNFSSSCTGMGGSGKMMVVDGGTSASDKVWEQQPGGGIPIITGATYIFSYWIQSISVTNAPGNLADIEVRLNNTVLTPTSGSTVCPATLCGWTQVTYTFVAPSGFAQIWLFDKQTSGTGNDFALDNLSLTKVPDPLTVTYAAVNPTCPNGSDGFITAYPAGGVPPYSYTLNGTTTNSNGVFTGLSASTGNTIVVTDAASTPATKTVSGITLTNPTDPLTVTGNTPICAGASANLSANGGSSGIYNWTSSPVDPTLGATGSNPTANPTTTTTYYVTTNHTTIKELIYNGHFDNSTNLGFNSDYANIPNNDANKVQKAFGIQVNPKTFESGFSLCPDHTTGSGNQMVVDGSTVANDKVWSQTVPVTPGTTYTFSYYVQTVSGSSPAQIETQINGSPITGVAVTSRFTSVATACNWSNVTYTWNSGAASLATIALIDRNTAAAGNDFALDDLSFYTTSICPLTDSIKITVNPAGTPVTGFSYASPVCKNGTNPSPTKDPGFSNGGVFSSTAGLSINASTGVIDLATSTPNTYTVTYTYAASGCNPLASSTANITINPAPVAGTLSGNQNICVGGNTTFSSTVAGGTWSSADITKATINSSTGAITGIAAGTVTMTYTVTGTGGCSNATATRDVTVTAAPVAGTLSGNQSICVGGSTTFSSTIAGGTWSSADITKATINSSTGAITGIAAGTVTMTYTVTGTGGCSNATATRDVTVTTAPIAGTLSGNQSICVGGNTTFSSTIAGGTWSSADITKATINSSTGAITGIAAGTVTMTYTVTGTGGCSNATATRDVTVTAAPIAGTLSGNQSICVGGNTTFNSTVAGGSWSSSDITKATINSSTGAITGIAAGNVTMTYTVTGTGGCSNATATRDVTVTAAPVAGTLSGNQNICITGTTTFSSTVAGGIWTSGDITKATINASTGTITPLATGTVTMTYTVTGTGGCSNVDATRDVIISAIPTAGTLSGNQNICVGGSSTFSSTVSGGTWSSSDITKATINASTGVINAIAAGTVTMTYTITGSGGCSNATATRSVTVTAAPIAGTLSGNQNICISGTTTFSSTVAGGTWTSADITKATINPSTGLVTAIAAGTIAMTYTVVGTGGCSNATATRNVIIASTPTAGTLSGNQNVCVGGNTTFSSTIPGGVWSSSDITKASINSTTGVITGNTVSSATITYTITGTGGCSDASATRTITVNPLLALSAETKTCEPGNVGYRVSFTATAGNAAYTATGSGAPGIWVGNTWTSGIIAAGANYSINVQDVNACNTVTVAGTAPDCTCPAKAVVSGGGSACADGTKLTVSIALSGTAPWNIVYTNGTTSTPVNNILTSPYTFQTDVAGTYVVTSVSDATCTGTSSGNALVNIIPMPTASISGTTSICPNTTTNITFTGTANAIVTYTVNGGANQTITLDATGAASLTTPSLNSPTTYALVSVATAGPTVCTQAVSSSAVVSINPAITPVTGFSYSPNTVCLNGTAPTFVPAAGFTTGGIFTATPAGLSVDANTGVINLGGSVSNTYTVTYTVAASGCSPAGSSTTNLSITGLTTPVTDFSYTPNTICVNGTNPTLTTAAGFATGGTYSATPAGLNINASTGAITIAGSLPNVYTITYSVAATSCSVAKSSSTTITIVDLPATPTVNVTTPTCTSPTATITVTSTRTGLTFSNDGVNYTNTTGIFTGIVAGSSYSITAKNSNGCISQAATGTVGTVPGAPAGPTVTVTPPTCTVATATITVTSSTTGVTFSNDGVNYTNTTGVFNNVPANSNYSITLKDAAGCISSPNTGTVPAQPAIPAAPTVVTTQPTCNIATVTVSVSSSTTGLSFSNDGTDYSNTTGIFNSISAGSAYSITAKNSAGCISPATVGTIKAQPKAPTANAGSDKVVAMGESVQLDGVATGDNITIQWTPNSNITGATTENPIVSPTQDQVYTMTVRSIDGCTATDNVTVRFLKDVIIPNVFSPNGDGTNDTWKITNIEDYPNASVEVFNRYGQFIFGSVGYTIRWDGKFKGQPVPVGPYYWIIKLRPESKPMSGTISVVR
ncbi:gliding motility-associated C-terminal domain-containing protein [Ferruginibacter sp. SUN002]|uniref:T9SS type B sorting domain-containing protein n=1 Tax=Ferruginibacter sp. SUN002 TaxID=2937789 RepID=UPI003D361EF2